MTVEVAGLEARRNDLARGIVVLRSRQVLDAAAQRRLVTHLAAAGITDAPDDDRPTPDPRQLLAAPWAPPSSDELERQRAGIDSLPADLAIEHVWFVKLETAVDGAAWQDEQRRSSAAAGEDDDGEDDDGDDDEADDDEDTDDEDTDDEDTDDSDADPEDEADDDTDDDGAESLWRASPPPLLTTTSFELERYPEILTEYDWEDFGIAIKLGGTRVLGEESIINAFFALWLSAYQDERALDFAPFREADVMHDRDHRSALLWVDHVDVPVTPADQVHFLIWVIDQLAEIVPIVWARFDHADLSAKSAWDSDGLRVVLAGNPLAAHVHRSGEEAALAWAASQALWSPREIAAMLIEVALTHDPDEIDAAAIAERLLARAAELDPESEASGLRGTVWIRQGRFADAIALATASSRPALRIHVLTEILAHAAGHIDDALPLADLATLAAIGDSTLGELAGAFAEHAPLRLEAYLDRLPDRAGLVPHLYNASFEVPRPAALTMLRRVVRLPPPPPADPDEPTGPVVVEADDGDDDEADDRQRQTAARRAYVMAWNNACIHAHALGDFAGAAALADGAQPYAAENPYIHHAAACAYVSVGDVPRALAQVEAAFAHHYPHLEKMETDADLAALHAEPTFVRLFRDWRAARDDLN